jgi:hypothetical protein
MLRVALEEEHRQAGSRQEALVKKEGRLLGMNQSTF